MANAKANKINRERQTGATDLRSDIRILLCQAHESIDPPCGDVKPLTASDNEIQGETVQDTTREVRAATTARGHVRLVTRRETHRSTLWTMEDRTVLWQRVDPLTASDSDIQGETVQDTYREVHAATTARGYNWDRPLLADNISFPCARHLDILANHPNRITGKGKG